MRFRTASFIGTAFAVAALACSKDNTGKAGSTSAATPAATKGARKDSTIRIALIAKSSTNPVFLAARTGAEAAAKELSEKNHIKIEVIWLTPPQEDGQVQA